MAQYPLPVVVISKLIDVASPAATEILEAGQWMLSSCLKSELVRIFSRQLARSVKK
jgi:hypothetical protein